MLKDLWETKEAQNGTKQGLRTVVIMDRLAAEYIQL